MWTIGPIGFAAPWLLLGLLTLPIIWLLLRAVPPAPIKRRFPGVALLLGLKDEDSQSDRTPWWLLLLRLIAIAAVIIGFAGPLLNPQSETASSDPLLIIADGTWADAPDWDLRIGRMSAAIDEAARAGRTVAVAALTSLPAEGVLFRDPDAVTVQLPGTNPNPWEPDMQAVTAWLSQIAGPFDTLWLSDGLERAGRENTLAFLESRGQVVVFQTPRPAFALRPAIFNDGLIQLTGLRFASTDTSEIQIVAVGPDPSGIERQLAAVPLAFEAGSGLAQASLLLPPELRNRITRFELPGLNSAGAIALSDDSIRRRKVALIAGTGDAEGLDLLSPLHFLRKALQPTADLVEGALADILLANPDVIILADVAQLAANEDSGLQDWVSGGGFLLRFAGPRLAASDIGRTVEAPLMPIRLRAGGRSVGGTLSWGDPKTLAPFSDTSPFFGLPVPADITVTTQVMAQPDPTLSDRVIAQLADGTPLVTRKNMGSGQVVLFHVTANAEWSTLPLSGLFVQMLERLAVSAQSAVADATDLTGTRWMPTERMDAFGQLRSVDALPAVSGELIASQDIGADLHPGLYDGEDRRIAVNVIKPDQTIAPAVWPTGTTVTGSSALPEQPLGGWLLALALGLLVIDALASMGLSGRLRGLRSNGLAAVALALALFPTDPQAQADDAQALAATSKVVLAHVLTGNAEIDATAAAGLLGLSNTLIQRTSVEPSLPMGVDIERDELAFFPFLYWPITANQTLPTRDAYTKLNRYLRSGGLILFDTRDADRFSFGAASPEGRRLQAIARGLDIPPLAPIPRDHVLTRSFYLLQDFPGRYANRDLWVEAVPADAATIDGMPFRNLNDGVTPVVIGGNDWASAWAIGENGMRLFPVGRGMAGERQREYAYRFGVNLVMHVLTGNYKSDQVHVPALLDRLGQ